jgi:hypothetical protein
VDGRYDEQHIMAGRESDDEGTAPELVSAPQTPATDSDLNELLTALGSRVKAVRRENKTLANHNRRLAVVLAERGVVRVVTPQPGETMVIPPGATAADLARELIRRLEMMDTELGLLREENARLTAKVQELDLPAWRIEETRVGTSRLVPGPRAFIRRRRT